MCNEELREFIKGELRKDGKEDELEKMIGEKARLKTEAKAKEIEEAEAEAAKRSRSAAVSSLLPSSLFGKKETEKVGETETASVEAAPAVDTNSAEEAIKGESSEETESKSEGANKQLVA